MTVTAALIWWWQTHIILSRTLYISPVIKVSVELRFFSAKIVYHVTYDTYFKVSNKGRALTKWTEHTNEWMKRRNKLTNKQLNDIHQSLVRRVLWLSTHSYCCCCCSVFFIQWFCKNSLYATELRHFCSNNKYLYSFNEIWNV